MDSTINREFFNQENEEMYTEYLELLVNRVTHSSMSLEVDLGNPDDSKNAIRLKDNMKAFKVLLNCFFLDEEFNNDLIIDVANLINDSSPFISMGYRNTGDGYIDGTNIPISKPESIEYEMEELLKRYDNDWKDMDPFEREARFHIDFIRIHPFEDGNGRTSRLILNYNLLRQGLAPVIITSDWVEYYQNYIRDYDIDGLKKLFQIQSKREQEIMGQLFEEYKSKKENIQR